MHGLIVEGKLDPTIGAFAAHREPPRPGIDGGNVGEVVADEKGVVGRDRSAEIGDRMRAELEVMSDRAGFLDVPDTADEIGALGDTLNELLGRVQAAVTRWQAFTGHKAVRQRVVRATTKRSK